MDLSSLNLDELRQGLLKFLGQKKKPSLQLPVMVESAVKLTPAQIKELTAILTSKLGQPINLTNQINKDLLGGLRIRFKDKLIDASLKFQVDSLQDQLIHE